MVRTLSRWLDMQSNSLIDFCLKTSLQPHLPPFEFPILRALKNLTIEIPAGDKNELMIPQPIVPFLPNLFPVLKKLELECYRENLGMFGTYPLPSVHELRLRHQGSPLSNPSWKIILPNLCSLHIQFDYANERFTVPTLHYILTCFTQLVHLELEVAKPLPTSDQEGLSSESPDNYSTCDYWDLLTGRAPRPVLRFTDSMWDSRVPRKAGATIGPVNGIYQIASLGNMKCWYLLLF